VVRDSKPQGDHFPRYTNLNILELLEKINLLQVETLMKKMGIASKGKELMFNQGDHLIVVPREPCEGNMT
jgi:hypothetical protein